MAVHLELATQIAALSGDIQALPAPTARAPTPPSPTPSPPLPSGETSPTKSRFSRFRAPFRRISSTASSRYLRARKGSEPLIKSPGPDSPNQQQPPTPGPSPGAADLLDFFAPLVSRLQALGHTLRDSPELDQDLVDDFAECCTELEKRIELFTQHHRQQHLTAADAEADPHDVEMKKLLLDALVKKVEIERSTTIVPPFDQSPPISRTNSNNPLVLHSSHVLAPPDSRRSSLTPPSRISESRSIPIAAVAAAAAGGDGNHLAPYPSFADAGQHVGLANVFRLGSFQNSLLFSPSPVAVRQPLRSSSGLSG